MVSKVHRRDIFIKAKILAIKGFSLLLSSTKAVICNQSSDYSQGVSVEREAYKKYPGVLLLRSKKRMR